LLVGVFNETSIENKYLRAFKKIYGVNVEIFNTINFKTPFNIKNFLLDHVPEITYWQIRNSLFLKFKTSKKKYNIVIIFKGLEFDIKFLRSIKSLSKETQWICINTDDPFNVQSRIATNKNIINAIPFYDVYFIWSYLILEKLKKISTNKVVYLPFAAEPALKINLNNNINAHKMCFIGTWDKYREDFISDLPDDIIEIYGERWNKSNINFKQKKLIFNKNFLQHECEKIYQSSLGSLNILRLQNKNSHNMRTFEITSWGGLLIANRTEEQNYFFPENVASLAFNSKVELINIFNSLKKNEINRNNIIKNSLDISKSHTYLHRALFILENIMNKRYKLKIC
jgi:hypothetical protein